MVISWNGYTLWMSVFFSQFVNRLVQLYPEIYDGGGAESQFQINALVLHHRVGRVLPGELAVVAVVYSQHRKDAFHACEALMNELKATGPIWKKEFNSDGSFWVSQTP